MKMKLSFITVFLFSTFVASSAFSQPDVIDGLGFKLNDDINVVKTALHTTADPEPMERNPAIPTTVYDPNKGKSLIHLRTKGIWVFFNPAGKVDTIRLDAPFAESIMGIKIGDNTGKVTATLGKPIKKPYTVFLTMEAYQYVLDDSAYVTFNANDDGVQFIFVTK